MSGASTAASRIRASGAGIIIQTRNPNGSNYEMLSDSNMQTLRKNVEPPKALISKDSGSNYWSKTAIHDEHVMLRASVRTPT